MSTVQNTVVPTYCNGADVWGLQYSSRGARDSTGYYNLQYSVRGTSICIMPQWSSLYCLRTLYLQLKYSTYSTYEGSHRLSISVRRERRICPPVAARLCAGYTQLGHPRGA